MCFADLIGIVFLLFCYSCLLPRACFFLILFSLQPLCLRVCTTHCAGRKDIRRRSWTSRLTIETKTKTTSTGCSTQHRIEQRLFRNWKCIVWFLRARLSKTFEAARYDRHRGLEMASRLKC
ncbi:hypothetical protein LIA77_11394 [Sarocladium implicatum]|nr:hypothetical protein LIA77_11394 [Sarocladium implicatum]